jgi:hypothetical protein
VAIAMSELGCFINVSGVNQSGCFMSESGREHLEHPGRAVSNRCKFWTCPCMTFYGIVRSKNGSKWGEDSVQNCSGKNLNLYEMKLHSLDTFIST